MIILQEVGNKLQTFAILANTFRQVVLCISIGLLCFRSNNFISGEDVSDERRCFTNVVLEYLIFVASGEHVFIVFSDYVQTLCGQA